MHSDRRQKGGILLSSCCHVVSLPFDYLNGLVSVYTALYSKFRDLVVDTLAEFHPCVHEISPFIAILYMYCVTRGRAISTLARRFRQSF